MNIPIVKNVMDANDKQAEILRTRFALDKTLVLNLIGSPGSGKTSILESSIQNLASDLSIGVIEGDPETSIDAERILKFCPDVVQIETSGGCHLNSNMVIKALDSLPDKHFDVIFIENVGNLLCPVAFDCGEDAKIAVLSVTEGDDKPKKYPALFHKSSLLLINKTDLLPYVHFDIDRASNDARISNPTLPIISLSCKNGENIQLWLDWIRKMVKNKLMK